MASTDATPIKFTVAFEGLMLFHNPPSGEAHLAVVDAAHGHQPCIYIYRKSTGKREDVVLHKGDRVTFYNTRPGRFRPDTFFKEHVPTLVEYLVRGHVHDNVAESIFQTGVLAYVGLPAGAMTTWHTLRDAVQLTRQGQAAIVCFARFAVLGPITASNVEIRIEHTSPAPPHDPYPIHDGDIVIVSNIARPSDEPHFREYQKFLNRDGLIGAMNILSHGCDENEEPDSVDPYVGEILTEHARSTFVPNGDCGPVDNP